ncbi:MAG: twin-arginine translocation signal domain-containing protein, partial [Armatimonadetes bacterium]|nr:twin-arginine translocation signal domain-containing protein [Armatimonadota bacterium]
MDERPDSDLSEETEGRSVSRREFLKMAGIAGAAIGLGAGFGGLLAACGDDESKATTTTAAAAGATTTVAAGMQKLKVGMILDYSFPLHVMWQHIMEAYVPHMNSNGGIKVGD